MDEQSLLHSLNYFLDKQIFEPQEQFYFEPTSVELSEIIRSIDGNKDIGKRIYEILFLERIEQRRILEGLNKHNLAKDNILMDYISLLKYKKTK